MDLNEVSNEAISCIARARQVSGILVKSLSANDTGMTASHQVGLLVYSSAGRELFPFLDGNKGIDEAEIDIVWTVSGDRTISKAKWYSSKGEYRITGSIGSHITPDMTGDLFILMWLGDRQFEIATFGREADIDYVRRELMVSPVSHSAVVGIGGTPREREQIAFVEYAESVADFPATAVVSENARRIYDQVYNQGQQVRSDPDNKLSQWVDAEFRLFRELERALVYPQVSRGFASIEEFVALANSVKNRRASRAGASLENHTAEVFRENNVTFDAQEVTELRKRPDFLFPRAVDYQNAAFPEDGLTMLAVKTTCKDRWRQVLNEAHRIETKHLLTLQQGVAVNQFLEMKAAQIQLVVPQAIHSFYPPAVRSELWTVKQFIAYVKQ